ncbi:MAG: hypothetical protein ACOYOP_11665 [Microthrixaceae bacterium]
MSDSGPITTVIERPRLLLRLRDQPVVVLAAPPGHGSSTLVAQLASARDGATAHVRLTAADGLGGVSAKVLEALAVAVPVLGAPSAVADTTGTARLAYALDVLAGPITLVVEDLHLLDPADAEALVATVDAHAEDGVALVVTTHGDLLPALARMVARRGGRVIGAEDLLFDDDECAALVAECGATNGPSLTGAEVRARTGGWPLAAGALVRVGEQVTPALASELLASLGTGAREELAAVALVGSVPVTVVLDGAHGEELLRFARRHPAAVELGDDRLAPRQLLVDGLAGHAPPPSVAGELADRLDRHGDRAAALLLLSRLPGDRAELQARLGEVGPTLLAAGRFRLLHEVISRIPAPSRRAEVLVLDASARLGLQQLEAMADAHIVGDVGLARLAERTDLDADLRLAVAGLRVEALRRGGDPDLVRVALEALTDVGPVDGSLTAADLVRDRSALARRGLHQALYGLGAAATFSGDEALMAEGGRLQELALGVAERAGIDTVALRGQLAYERVGIALLPSSAAVASLEASVVALRSMGHPEAANHLAQLGDLHVRLGDATAALACVGSGRDWAERTGNHLVVASLDLVAGGARLVSEGPSAQLDDELADAWERFVASPRLRRAAPTVAIRFANAQLDHDDPGRAAVWLDRARTLLADRLQGGYQADYLQSVEERVRALGRPVPPAAVDLPERFTAQPAGLVEYAATRAWDLLRHGDDSLVADVLARFGDQLDPPWPQRLGLTAEGDAGTPAEVVGGPELVVRLMGPEVALARRSRPVPSPSGHAARLLAQLVLRDGVMTAEAAMEDLWPDTAPAAARNRFHQVLHRVRRALGVGADGPLTVTDGVVRLDPRVVGSDVAELRSLGGADLAVPVERARAVALLAEVRSSLLAAQFAYDEALDEDRWDLDRRVVELAVDVLTAGPDDPDVRAAVWGVWDRFPDRPELGEALRRTADDAGLGAEAERARRRLDASAA